MTALPAAATKVHLDSGSDSPANARAELADHIDKFNTLRSWATGLFGTDGVIATARTTLVVPSTHEVRDQVVQFADTTGSSATFAATLSPVPAGYTDGMRVALKLNAALGTDSTINLNSLGAKKIYRPQSTGRVQSGDTAIDQVIELTYNEALDSAAGGFSITSPILGSAAGGYQSSQSFITSGAHTWTRPAGVTKIRVRVRGAGAGSGGIGTSATDGGATGGGGQGGYSEKWIDVSAISSVSVTVGAAGTAGTSGGSGGTGGTGGTTSFGSHLSATGGVGSAGANGATQGAPGAGGAGSDGAFNNNGAPGAHGSTGGAGGGEGGGINAAGVKGGGGAGSFYAGGPVAGRAGGVGWVIVEEFS